MPVRVVVIAMIMMMMVMSVMIMRGVVVLSIIVRSNRMPMVATVGAAFRIERRFDFYHARAETSCHGLDDVIAADAQSFAHDLRRQMAIAEMPGDTNEMLRIAAANFSERLRRCDHLDEATVFQHQRVAAPQRNGIFKIKQELKPARAVHRHPPPVTVIEAENDGVGRRLFPVMPALNAGRTDHARTLPPGLAVIARRPFPA